VFIGLTDEAKEKVEPFAKELGMTYAVGGGSRAGGEYGATSIPTAFVVDTTGKVAWAGHPMDEKFVPAIDAELKKAPPKAAVESKGPASLDEVAALLQKAQYGRAAAMLAKFQVPEGDTTAKSRVDRMRKTLVAQAPTRLAQGEKSLTAKEYYKASEAFKDVLAMAPDSPQANKAQEHLKGLEVDENLKAEIDQGRQKAADDLLAEILKHEKAYPAATLKALEDLIDRFPDTKAATLAAKKVKWLSAKGSGAKTG
jgi:tetratricopeptide (TPR) repeat protein